MLKKFLLLHREDISNKVRAIFYLGWAPIFYIALTFGGYTAHNNRITKLVPAEGSGHVVTTVVINNRLGYIAGIALFIALILLWRFLFGKLLISNNSTFFKKFFSIGDTSVDTAINVLFYIGIILIIIPSGFVTRVAFYIPVFNRLGNIIVLIISYLLSIVLWKIACELLLAIFRCFEAYYQSKK